MDQIKEERDSRELRELLVEILKVQERILHRVERMEEAITRLQGK
jgi:hypothetical protein